MITDEQIKQLAVSCGFKLTNETGDDLKPYVYEFARELIKTAPEKIYLCVSDDESSRDEPFPDYQGEVTWADHQAVPVNVEYVRSDKVIDDEIRHRLILVCEYLETVGLMFVSPRVISSQIRAILEAGQ